MFRSGLTSELYKTFCNSYQTTNSQNFEAPFVYVDDEGIRVIANVRSDERESGVVTISVATDDDMEIIAFE